MIIIKILGVLDIFIGLMFWLFGIFGLFPELMLLLGLILLVKGIVFITGLSIISFLDIILGFIIIGSTGFEMPKIIVIIISLFLLQKGIFSLLS
ncbi:MAG: hypothetical protein WC438_01500 [Candidatus Pacearchaeota archaeon]